MISDNSFKNVLVTGGSGYLGLHIVFQLLDATFVVHTTTRNANHVDLQQLKQKFPTRLFIFKANLLQPSTLLAAMQGVDTVVHVASPVIMKTQNPQKDLIEPAVQGTLNLLETCLKVPTVKHIVVTSSTAAIYSSAPKNDHTYTELDFNRQSTIEDEPYYYAKTQAELIVWQFNEKHKDRYRIVTILPSTCFGPTFSLNNDKISLNYNSKRNVGLNIIEGVVKSGTKNHLKGGTNMVDVREVALAHLKAVQNINVQGRYLVSNQKIGYDTLRDYIVKYTKLSLEDLQEDLADRGNGLVAEFDNSKSKKVLVIEYRPIQDTIKNTLLQIVDLQKE